MIMKRIYITFATALIACTALTISCKKKDEPAPTATTTTTTTTTTTKGSSTPDSYPFDVSKMFLPTGFYGPNPSNPSDLGGDGGGATGAGAVTLTFPTSDSLWFNSHAEMQVTNKFGWGGFAFLNNNEWATKYHFAAGATKLTFDLKADPGVKVKLTAFPTNANINKTDSLVGTDANAWVTKTITFSAIQADSLKGSDFITVLFSPPAGATQGQTYNFAIRNVVLDK
jgi:hypothetical protein